MKKHAIKNYSDIFKLLDGKQVWFDQSFSKWIAPNVEYSIIYYENTAEIYIYAKGSNDSHYLGTVEGCSKLDLNRLK